MTNYLGELIRALRLERGLTQKQLGALLGFSKAAISLYEQPAINRKPETLKNIARVLQVDVNKLHEALAKDQLDDLKRKQLKRKHSTRQLMPTNYFGIAITVARIKRHIGTTEMCKSLGIHSSSLYRLENGERLSHLHRDILIERLVTILPGLNKQDLINYYDTDRENAAIVKAMTGSPTSRQCKLGTQLKAKRKRLKLKTEALITLAKKQGSTLTVQLYRDLELGKSTRLFPKDATVLANILNFESGDYLIALWDHDKIKNSPSAMTRRLGSLKRIDSALELS